VVKAAVARGAQLVRGKVASSHLVSCRQIASGEFAASQSSRCGSLTRSEFTFQVAIFKCGRLLGLVAGLAGQARACA
jgi:hypothetical protein